MFENITQVINNSLISPLRICLITIGLFVGGTSFGQDNIDSLKALIDQGNGSVQANALMKLFNIYRTINLDTALHFAKLSNETAYRIGDSLLFVRTEIAIGYVYHEKGFYPLAINHYLKALKGARRNGYKDREKFVLNNLGLTNYYNGKYDDALEYHFQSLALREADQNRLEIAISCNNIGLVYYQIKDYNKAIEFFKKSLALKKALEDDNQIESTLINLGLCYSGLTNYEEALDYFDKVLRICERQGCAERIKIEALNGSGLAYYSLKDFLKAEDYLNRSNSIARTTNLNNYIVINLYYLASIKKEQGLINEALLLLKDCHELAVEIDSRVWINRNFQLFGELYSSLREFEQAYQYQRKYDSLSGLILNEEVVQNLAKIQINYQERENIETINLQKTELTRRTTLLILSIIIIFLAIIIVFMLFKNNRHRKNVNRKLSEANDTIEKQNLELTNMNHVLEERVKERTQELKASNAALLKSNTDLDNFIYKTSHDIRGPLATLQGMCNVALIDIEEPKAVGYFNKLATTAQRLNEILSKLLVINQINNSLISEEPVNIESLLREVIDQQQQLYGNKILVKEDIESNLNFISDVDLVKLIISNLITNAFKFHNTSERVASFVHISVGRCDGNLCLQVTDNGIGIDDKVSSKIFEIFSKASDMSDTAGLGLYLAKLAVEKLGGEIDLSKTKEGYTCFSVKIPGLQ